MISSSIATALHASHSREGPAPRHALRDHYAFDHSRLQTFKSTNGWQGRFIHRESGAADADGTARARRVLPKLLAEHSPEDIYNADEFAVVYRHTPQRRRVNQLL